MILIRRSFVLLLAICMGCVAQSAPTDLAKKMERQIRATYKVPAEVKILVGAPAADPEFPGFEKVIVTVDNGAGKKQDLTFLLSKDHTSMMRVTKFDLTKDPFAETMAKMEIKGRPTRGAKDAKVVVVNFDDFECPFCSRLHQTLFPQLLKEYGDRVEFVYKDFPLVEIHPWAMHAAVDANCLAVQNPDAYWDFADYIHSNQSRVNNEKTPQSRFDELDKISIEQAQKHNLDVTRLQACMKAQDESEVKASTKVAESLGLEATPAIFINGEELPGGAVPIGQVRAAIDRALKDANVPAPDQKAAAATPASR